MPDLTGFSIFHRAIKKHVPIVQGTSRIFKPSDAVVIEIARGIVSRQYPPLMPILCPGRLMTTPPPFTMVKEMWAAFKLLAINKTMALNGACFDAISFGGHVTYTSLPSAHAHQAPSFGFGTHAHGSLHNRLVMKITDNDADSFLTDESDLVLWSFEAVYTMTTTFSTPEPPLLTPLLICAARAQVLRTHGVHRLKCNGPDHSMKTRSQAFLITARILNPALGQLNDGGHAYRQ